MGSIEDPTIMGMVLKAVVIARADDQVVHNCHDPTPKDFTVMRVWSS